MSKPYKSVKTFLQLFYFIHCQLCSWAVRPNAAALNIIVPVLIALWGIFFCVLLIPLGLIFNCMVQLIPIGFGGAFGLGYITYAYLYWLLVTKRASPKWINSFVLSKDVLKKYKVKILIIDAGLIIVSILLVALVSKIARYQVLTGNA